MITILSVYSHYNNFVPQASPVKCTFLPSTMAPTNGFILLLASTHQTRLGKGRVNFPGLYFS